jgi:hypothetical protein
MNKITKSAAEHLLFPKLELPEIPFVKERPIDDEERVEKDLLESKTS